MNAVENREETTSGFVPTIVASRRVNPVSGCRPRLGVVSKRLAVKLGLARSDPMLMPYGRVTQSAMAHYTSGSTSTGPRQGGASNVVARATGPIGLTWMGSTTGMTGVLGQNFVPLATNSAMSAQRQIPTKRLGYAPGVVRPNQRGSSLRAKIGLAVETVTVSRAPVTGPESGRHVWPPHRCAIRAGSV